MNPASATYVSAPFTYQPDPAIPVWNVSTYSHTYSGEITVQQATLQSDNTVYAQLTLDVGPQNVADMAHKLGVQSPLEPVPSIGLGSNAVSPLDMASAYATLAAGGVYSQPMAIRKVILPNGKEDDQAGWGTPIRRRVIPDGVAYTVTKILEQNVLYGTGTRANFGRPAAGKTGTTDDHADAWFCGYLPESRGDRLGRLSAGRDPDGERPRDRGRRRQLPGRDLAPLHGAGDAVLAAAGLRAAQDVPGVEAVPPGPVRDRVRVQLDVHVDHDRDDSDDDRGGDDDDHARDDDGSDHGSGGDDGGGADHPASLHHAALPPTSPPATTAPPPTEPPPTETLPVDDHVHRRRSRRCGSAPRASPCGRRCSRRRSCSARSRFRAAGSSGARSSGTCTSTASTATLLLGGHVPYRDFFVEYPPGAIPLFAGPSLAPGGAYDAIFKVLMTLCCARRRSSASPTCSPCRALRGSGSAAAALFLALVADRARAGLAEHVRRLAGTRSPRQPSLRWSPGAAGSRSALLGVAAAAKLYAVLLVPLALVWLWRRRRPIDRAARGLRRRRRRARSSRGSRSPPAGCWDSVHSQVGRGLHTESLGASVLLAADRLG